MSMFEEYLNERRGLRVWRTHNAFLTWKPTDDNGVYIQDIYVTAEARKQAIGTKLADDFVAWLGINMPSCQRLYGSVDFTANNPEPGLIAMLRYGFKVKDVIGKGLWLCKEL